MATWLFANGGILAVYGTDPGPNGVGGIKEASVQVSGSASKAVIACSYLFVASYAPTWGPVSWIYPAELYPNRVRGKAVALATSGNWAFNFALGTPYLDASDVDTLLMLPQDTLFHPPS